MELVRIKNFLIGKQQPLAIISGPCVIESEEHTLRCAEELKTITADLPVSLIFKASYDKANRMAYDSFRGPGLEKGLRILEKVQMTFGLPVLTDVHCPEEALVAGEICDMLQVPAFLCRQTDLVIAAGKTGKPVNVKKGQFMAPWDMKNVVEKLRSVNNNQILLTDRGLTLGYNNLVSDMRAIPLMQQLGVPVCFDASHSVQIPGGLGTSSGGQREFIPTLARAAVAAGCNAIFIETHTNPAESKSDRDSIFPLSEFKRLLQGLIQIYKVVNDL